MTVYLRPAAVCIHIPDRLLGPAKLAHGVDARDHSTPASSSLSKSSFAGLGVACGLLDSSMTPLGWRIMLPTCIPLPAIAAIVFRIWAGLAYDCFRLLMSRYPSAGKTRAPCDTNDV